MIIFYDPNDSNRIKAIYTHNTTSKTWEERGYIRAEVPKEWNPSQDHLYKVDGLILDPLPVIKPEPHPLEGKSFDELTQAEKDSLLLEMLTNAGMLEEGKVK